MSVEPRRIAKTEVWTDWESRIVNGLFPLRRFLGGSNHSAVFLTEYKAENLPDAAIKFVPADPLHAEEQLLHWGTAATLSHPHLVRIFDVGRCQFGGRAFLYVVMEYAEQTLAQILPKRVLTPEEASEMLLPALDALSFLHQSGLVHSRLRPANFLVVNDQLKLASDPIRPAGSAANDVWDLGITLVEALTQRTPTWLDEQSEVPTLPATLPPEFVATARKCLSRTPANRPTVFELGAQYKRALQPLVRPADEPGWVDEPRTTTPEQESPQRPLLVPAMAVVFLLALATFVWLRYFAGHPNSERATITADTTPRFVAESRVPLTASAPPTATSPPPIRSQPPPAAEEPVSSASTTVAHLDAAPAHADATATLAHLNPDPARAYPPAIAQPTPWPDVLHAETPNAPHPITERIRGHVKVTVRVLVDPNGTVVGEFMESPGPSHYFARLASDAAEKWRFVESDNRNPRVWLLRFEFTRDGTTVAATTAQ